MASMPFAPERLRIFGADVGDLRGEVGAARSEPREEALEANRRCDQSRVEMEAGQEERLEVELA
jgi:hypothetical protein